MAKWPIVFAVLALASPSIAAELDYQCLAPPVEVRAIWIDAGAIPKTPQGIRKLVRAYHSANMNVLFPEVVARGYTVYESKLLARDPRFKGCPDLLSVMITEAHKLRIEVHPWVSVFRAGYAMDRGAILTAHPDWIELNKDGIEPSPNGGLWISPCIKPARDFLADLFAELVCKYDVDGLHLDYIRYQSESAASFGYSPASKSLFEKQYGVDPMLIQPFSIEQYEWTKFRERQINTFVQRIALQTRRLKPRVKLSAAVGPNPKSARLDLMQNWVNWLDNKWLDFVVPMAYSTDDQYFRNLLDAESTATGGRALIVPGIGIFRHPDPQQSVAQIGYSREKLTAGQALFSASYFKPEFALALKRPYASPSRIPFRDTESAIRDLRAQADASVKQGNPTLSQYLLSLADALSTYLDYQKAPTPYVPPTEAPIRVQDNVIPLPEVTVPRTASAPVIDGSLDDPAWQNAATVKLEHTNAGEPASLETTAYLAYDDGRLYVAFRCDQPDIGKAKPDAKDRDGNVFYDDSVEVFLRPSDAKNDYFHFAVNTMGVRFDQRILDTAWNADWQAMCKVLPNAWTAEVAIPFAALGCPPPSRGSTWGINLARNRVVSRKIATFVWAVPYGTLHTPDRFGRITF